MDTETQRARAVLPKLHAVARQSGGRGLVLTSPGAVAWATGGANIPVDRSAGTDTVWVFVPGDGQGLPQVLTTRVEAPRMRAEGPFATLGWPVTAVAWSDEKALVEAVEHVAGAAAADVAADAHPAFGRDMSGEIAAARMALTRPECEALSSLAADATSAVEDALRAWHPGERDAAVAARIAAGVETQRATSPVLLVGGDDRLRRFRHPVAVGAPMRTIVMAVLVAARSGLHVALTRFAATPDAARDMRAGLAAAREIHADVLQRCAVGTTAGSALEALADSYDRHGRPGAWREHYQGGPIGYAQREFEIAPDQQGSPWWGHRFEANTALAWNPSLGGGAKDEDTYLLTADGLRCVTASAAWPGVECRGFYRPDVLVVEQ